jgi:hypothetical protein
MAGCCDVDVVSIWTDERRVEGGRASTTSAGAADGASIGVAIAFDRTELYLSNKPTLYS